MIIFQRMTTEYLALEDRLRVTGETKDQDVITLWLTQRLLLRLLPHVIKWLEKQTLSEVASADANIQTKEMLQEFAQHSARAELAESAPVKPVRAEIADSTSVTGAEDTSFLLVESVDVKKDNQSMQLFFKSPNKTPVGIMLTAKQMRQWLAIIRDHWQKAAWAMSIWPKWIGKPVAPESIETGPEFH